MPKKIQHVRAEMTTGFVLLGAEETIAQAGERLAQAGVSFGIVTNPQGVPICPVSAGELAALPSQEARLQEISKLPTFTVDADARLDQTVSFSAQTLVENPELAGLVVEDQGVVVGVLPRGTIRKYAQRIKTRGGDITELPGVPQIRAKYFVCPQQDFRKLIVRYDPDDPPTCPVHNVALVEQP